MSRLDELRQIGFRNLKAREKREYQRLLEKQKKDYEEVDNIQVASDAVETVSPGSDNSVIVKKATLDSLVARLDALENEKKESLKINGLFKSGGWEEIKKGKKVKSGTIRKYREDTDSSWKYVMEIKFLKWEISSITQEKEQIYMIYLFDPKKPKTLKDRIVMTTTIKNYAETFERSPVKILEKKKVVLRKHVGETQQVIVDYANYKSTLGDMVPMYESMDKIEVYIELETGDKMWVDANKLNQ